jgi:hypothetical protein
MSWTFSSSEAATSAFISCCRNQGPRAGARRLPDSSLKSARKSGREFLAWAADCSRTCSGSGCLRRAPRIGKQELVPGTFSILEELQAHARAPRKLQKTNGRIELRRFSAIRSWHFFMPFSSHAPTLTSKPGAWTSTSALAGGGGGALAGDCCCTPSKRATREEILPAWAWSAIT